MFSNQRREAFEDHLYSVGPLDAAVDTCSGSIYRRRSGKTTGGRGGTGDAEAIKSQGQG